MRVAANTFNADINGLKTRFYDFLAETDPTGFVDYNIEAFYVGKVEPDEYNLNPLKSKMMTIHFDTVVFENDGGEVLYFNMPLQYIDNPDRWEQKVLTDMAHERNLIEDALIKTFGEKQVKHQLTTMKVFRVPYSFFIDVQNIRRFLQITFPDLLNVSIETINERGERSYRSRHLKTMTYDRQRGILYDQSYRPHYHNLPDGTINESMVLGRVDVRAAEMR